MSGIGEVDGSPAKFGLVTAIPEKSCFHQQGIDLLVSCFPFHVLSKISYLSVVCLLHILGWEGSQLSDSVECWLSMIPSPNIIYLMSLETGLRESLLKKQCL